MKLQQPIKLIISLIILLVMGYSPGASASEKTDILSQQLTQSLQALNSFQAQYRAVSPEKEAIFKLQYNQKRKFCLAKIEVNNQSDKWLVLDYSKMGISPLSPFELYILSGKGGNRYPVSMPGLFEKLNNPPGIANFMHQLIDPNFSPFISPGEGSPKIKLSLTASELNINFEMSHNKGALRASWSDKASLKSANKIEESPEAVKLFFEDNHVISIDPRTGLLLFDRWPGLEKAGPREIRLESYSELKVDQDYREQIPDFEQVRFKDMPLNNLKRELYPTYFKHLVGELEKVDNYEEKLKAIPDSRLTALASRKISVETIQLNPEQTKAYLKQVLYPYYQKLIKQSPQDKMSFLVFLKRLLNEVNTDTIQLMTPGARQFTQQLHREINQIVVNIPAKKRQSVRALMTRAIKPVFDVWVGHYFQATIRQAIELVEKNGVMKTPDLPLPIS